MAGPPDLLDEVIAVIKRVHDLGLRPVLVGGMALVIRGSQRVTRDFDVVVAQPGPDLKSLVGVLYDHRLELAARVTPQQEIIATISNRRVALARLKLDQPSSAFFFNTRTGLRVDLLFDYPLPAKELAGRATRMKVRSHVLLVACTEDLLQLKRIASSRRSAPGDAEDIAFLEQLLREE
jgi:hypothetical protein